MQNGKNVLNSQKRHGLIYVFFSQLSDILIIILLIAAAISFFTAIAEKSNDYADSIIILMIVILNAVMGTVQNSKAMKAIDALKKLTSPHSTVLRDGIQKEILSEDIVEGDIILLKTGDIIPCDARLIESNSLLCDESSLTGESIGVEKSAVDYSNSNLPLSEQKNMIFSSCAVLRGNCKAICVATGMDTQVGHIAKLLDSSDSPDTPLKKRLNKTGSILGIAILFICAGIFLLGIFKSYPPMPMFMISISLAVAAIPEGLPAIVTTLLSLGVSKMVKCNVIVRHLPAVEALGCATVICSDKTGTLTQNKMAVTKIALPDSSEQQSSSQGVKLFSYGVLCCNATEENAEPTEKAIYEAAKKATDISALRFSYNRLKEIPFSSERKMMSVVYNFKGKELVITKGAPDYILPLCSNVEYGGKIQAMSLSIKEKILQQNENMAQQALRVIAVAYKNNASAPLESSLTFLGLMGIIDPPRPEAVSAIQECKNAGIKTVMITGDHLITATAIADKMGILNGKKAITGAELDKLSDKQLSRQIYDYSVFARVTPAHKARIVKAFRSRGEIVAMTGDGVNDAPALKLSDIGCAMGKNGTQVAKEASDLILTDDNFASIVTAVKEGRGIYENIKRAVRFLLSCNVGEILAVSSCFLLSLPTALAPIQLLFVNLVTDGLPALALGAEKPNSDIMHRKPVNPKDSLFSNGLGLTIIAEGIMIGLLALFTYVSGLFYFTKEAASTMCFCVLSLSQLAHTLNMKSEKSLFKCNPLKNKFLALSILICTFLQVSVVSLPFLANIFNVVPLSIYQWSFVFFISLLPIVLTEAKKLIRKFFTRRTLL